jgi:hypothetical protein
MAACPLNFDLITQDENVIHVYPHRKGVSQPLPRDGITRMTEMRNAYKIFVGKPEGKEITCTTQD